MNVIVNLDHFVLLHITINVGIFVQHLGTIYRSKQVKRKKRKIRGGNIANLLIFHTQQIPSRLFTKEAVLDIFEFLIECIIKHSHVSFRCVLPVVFLIF